MAICEHPGNETNAVSGPKSQFVGSLPKAPEEGAEEVRYWIEPRLDNLELLRARFARFAFKPHIHDGYAIGVILHGVERFDLRGASHRAPFGHVVMVNPGEVHTGEGDDGGGWGYRMFYPPAGLLAKALRQLGGQGTPLFRSPVIHDTALAGQLAGLHRLLETDAPLMERQTAWALAAAHLIGRFAHVRPPDLRPDDDRQHNRAVALARDYLEDNFPRQVTMTDLARLTGLSTFHLIRVFRRAHGLPPHAYLNHIRLVRARRMLAQGEPIAQAALNAGFADQSHLTRRFKAAWGITPGRYVRAISFKK